MLKYIILITLVINFINCGAQMDKTNNDPIKQITHFLDSQTEILKIPAIQYVVVDSSKTILSYASGYADIENHSAIQTNSTMMAYSMTKTFTAVAILQLVESGQLNLDDPVKKHLPDIPYGDKILIKHLITHTSGIPNPIPLKWAHKVEDNLNFNESDELTMILKKYNKVKFEPGERYFYSNIGYWLLGKIIEEVTHVSFTEYISKEIVYKLFNDYDNLTTTIKNPELHAKGYLAKNSFLDLIKGFMLDNELIGEYEDKWLHINNHYLNGPAFGGLIGSAQDFAIFLQDQLKSHSALINEEIKSLLYTQQKNHKNEPIEMSLGWHVGNLDGVQYFYKEGGGGGYHCEMRLYPSIGIGTIIMVNRTNFSSKKYLNDLDKAFF